MMMMMNKDDGDNDVASNVEDDHTICGSGGQRQTSTLLMVVDRNSCSSGRQGWMVTAVGTMLAEVAEDKCNQQKFDSNGTIQQ